MNRKSLSRNFFPLALIVLIICWTIFPVISLQDKKSISSYGIISYSTTGTPSQPTAEPTETPTETPTEQPQSAGGLHVDGKYLKDSSGNRVILRGVCYDSGQWWDAGKYGEEQISYMKQWGCNVVRVGIEVYSIDVGVMSNPVFLSRLDNIINWAEIHGLYVILDGWHAAGPACEHGYGKNLVEHQFTYHYTWTQWFNHWIALATRYKDKNHVIYELFNEPLHWNLADHQTKMRQCIDNIRAIDPDAVCILNQVGSGSWDTANFLFEKSYPISRPNIIYSAHLYGYHMSENTQDTIRFKLGSNGAYTCYADWMLENGRCVMSTEFGPGKDGNPNPGWDSWQETLLNSFMTVLDTDGYSGYTAWRWVDFGWTCEHLINDWNGNPTSYGSVIRQYFLSKL